MKPMNPPLAGERETPKNKFAVLREPQTAAREEMCDCSDTQSWTTTAWGAHGHTHSRVEQHRHFEIPVSIKPMKDHNITRKNIYRNPTQVGPAG
jgi:hypothetical protein